MWRRSGLLARYARSCRKFQSCAAIAPWSPSLIVTLPLRFQKIGHFRDTFPPGCHRLGYLRSLNVASSCLLATAEERRERLSSLGLTRAEAIERIKRTESLMPQLKIATNMFRTNRRSHTRKTESERPISPLPPIAIYLLDLGVEISDLGKLMGAVPASFETEGLMSNVQTEHDAYMSMMKEKELVEKVELLHTLTKKLVKWGIAVEHLPGILKKSPRLVRPPTALIDGLDDRKNFLASLGIEGHDFRRAIRRFPNLMVIDCDSQRERVEYLKQMGFSTASISRMVVRFPNILAYRCEEMLGEKLKILQDVGFSRGESLDILTTMPQMFAFRAENITIPRIVFLNKVLGIPAANIKLALHRSPPFFYYRLHETVVPKLDFLLDFLSDNWELFTRSPPMILTETSFNLSDWEDTVRNWMGPPDVQKFVRRWHGARSEIREELTQIITTYPQIVSCSIERRIRPRLLAIKAKLLGLIPDSYQGRCNGAQLSLSGHAMGNLMSLSDSVFATRKLRISPTEYERLCIDGSLDFLLSSREHE